jgi:F0F1-type ATP synthase beta subunit
MGIMAQNKLAYSRLASSEVLIKNEILANSQGETAIGLASALILVKAYANCLLVEVNQICYGGIVRTIALGFTEGISSWKVESLCTYQPLVVPVGRSTLGRLFNVLGATIDAYAGIDELPIYSESPVSFNQYKAEHSTQEIQSLELTSVNSFVNTIKIHTEEELQALDFQLQYTLNNLINRSKSITQNIN